MEEPGLRFIPARAGNAPTPPPRTPISAVHPRAGGERTCSMSLARGTGGSSPRGRGTQDDHMAPTLPTRFIPARAGNAPTCTPKPRELPVHPRAGGERHHHRQRWQHLGGSSPRGRGTLVRPFREIRIGRFIPARAGNASRGRSWPESSPVHPRAGGERVSELRAGGAEVGSSPRGRGTRSPSLSDPGPDRFIPARAGNASRVPPRRGPPAVHPRAGGERLAATYQAPARVGSSPRGRGTHTHPPRRRWFARFIPARAGNALRAC